MLVFLNNGVWETEKEEKKKKADKKYLKVSVLSQLHDNLGVNGAFLIHSCTPLSCCLVS